MIGYLLFKLAQTVAAIAPPLGVLYTVIRRIVKGEIKTLGRYFIGMGYVYDVLINTAYGDFFNDVFKKNKVGYPYGNPNESLSRVLGKNKALGTLTKTEFWVAKQLNKLDKDHVEKAAR